MNPTPVSSGFRPDVFMRHVKDSLKSLKRNGWMSVAAISAVTVTLFLVGIFMALLLNVNRISGQFENDVRVRVLVSQKATKKQRDDLEEKLKDTKNVTKVTYRSRNQELDHVVGAYGSQWKMFSGDSNPLNDVFLVDTKTPKQTIGVAKKVKKYAGVESATYGGDAAKKLFKAVETIQRWGLGFTLLLLFVAIFLIYNTIRITILSRRSEIGVMRLVGATNRFIRTPFLLEGAWTGLFGSLLPIVLVDLGYTVVHNSANFTMGGNGFTLYPTMPFLLWLDLLIALIGIVIGALGAVLSMRKFLRV